MAVEGNRGGIDEADLAERTAGEAREGLAGKPGLLGSGRQMRPVEEGTTKGRCVGCVAQREQDRTIGGGEIQKRRNQIKGINQAEVCPPKLSIMRIIICKITSFVIYKTGWRLKFGVLFLWYRVSLRESARVYHKFSTRFKNMYRTFVLTFPRNCMGGLDIKALPLSTST